MQKIILDLVKAIVQRPDMVSVVEIDRMYMAFEVKVSNQDCQTVLSKIDTIRSLSSSFGGLPEGQRIFIQVTAA